MRSTGHTAPRHAVLSTVVLLPPHPHPPPPQAHIPSSAPIYRTPSAYVPSSI